MVDLLVEPLDAEAGLRQVAGDGHDPALGRAEALGERVDLAARPLAHEQWIVPSRLSSSCTRCRPMKPVAPVTK